MGVGMVVDGGIGSAADGREFETEDPAEAATLARVACGGTADVERAVAAARRASLGWGGQPAAERARLLVVLADRLDEAFDELAVTESRETGKPLSEAKADVAVAVRYFEFYAGAIEAMGGRSVPAGPSAAWTEAAPYGVVGVITPWNYPLAVAARSVAPALAAGNACVVKPAPQGCLSVIRLGLLALEAGLPPGVLNVVPGQTEAGRALAAASGVDRLAFTGSRAAGEAVMRACAEHVRPLSLELGGACPQVVFADADLEAAADAVARAALHNAGQTCTAGSRLVVEASAAEGLVAALAARFESVRLGRGLDEPDMGPLISAERLRAVESAVAGAAVLAGGGRGRVEGLSGHFYRPVIVEGDPWAGEEVLGPLLRVQRFPRGDEAAAVALANATPYGLAAGIWTSDQGRALRLARVVDAGQVFVNCYGGGVELPLAPWKASGVGVEKGLEALWAYSRLKVVALAG